jgi:hypothetical protein
MVHELYVHVDSARMVRGLGGIHTVAHPIKAQKFLHDTILFRWSTSSCPPSWMRDFPSAATSRPNAS